MIEKANNDKLVFLRKCKYLIFDIDGTLFDSLSDYRQRWFNIWKQPGISKEKLSPKIQIILSKIEKNAIYIIDEYLGNIGILIKKIIWKNLKMETERPKLFPGVVPILNKIHLSSKIQRILLVSSASFEVNERLEKAKIKKYFYLALGLEQGLKRKHPAYFIEKLNIAAEEFCRNAIIIGDSPQDMKIAKKYSIFAIGVAHSCCAEELFNAGADLVIDKIGDLIEYF